MLAAIFGEEEIAGVLLEAEAEAGEAQTLDARDAHGRTAVILTAACVPKPVRRDPGHYNQQNSRPIAGALRGGFAFQQMPRRQPWALWHQRRRNN